MALTTIEFGPVNRRRVGTATVYLKQYWRDEWVEQPYLEVDELTWSVAPSLPTASLTWHYGIIARPNATTYTRVARLAGKHRYYCKIVLQLEYDEDAATWTSKTWYGVIDIQEDQIGGTMYVSDGAGGTLLIPRGEQQLTAYGLERILQETFFTASHWNNNGIVAKIERGLTFNPRGLPNRHPTKLFNHWLFAARRDDNNNLPVYWSTRKAIEYLVHWPVSGNPPFSILPADAANLPDWDKPELETEGVRIYDLIEQLIPRQRLVGWWLDVQAAELPDFPEQIRLRTFTYTKDAIVLGLGGATPIPANTTQYELVADKDRTATVALKETTITAYDRVILRGRRRRSCFTLSVAADSLTKGWSNTQQTDYETGPELDPGYPAEAEVKERQQWLQEWRSRDQTRPVFRRFILDSTWNGRAAAGIDDPEDPSYSNSGHPVFPQHPPLDANPAANIAANATFPVYKIEMELLPTLPLLAGVTYTGDVIKNKTVDESTARRNREELPMLVAWPLPNTTPQRWANVEELGRNAALEKVDDSENNWWSGDIRVLTGEPAFEINVHGQPQHVIAHGDFAPTDEDDLLGPFGEHDWRDMLATICMADDRYVQGVWPAAIPAERLADAPRELYIDAGDGYYQDYVVPGTIVGIKQDGSLLRSTGGYLRDDTPILTAGAHVAYEWYKTTRRVLTLATQYLLDFELGSFVTTIGDATDPDNSLAVNSPMTEFKVLIPRSDGDAAPEAPTMTITTGHGELDLLRTLGIGGRPLQAEAAKPLRRVPKL